MRQMVMVGFLQAQNCTNLVSSWRHPESRRDTWSPEYYADLGRVLEDGKFHVAKPHHHQDRYGIKRVNGNIVPGEVVDHSDNDRDYKYLKKKLKPGLSAQEPGDPIHCYSCSRTQRIAKCCSSVAFRRFIFSLILAR